MTRKIKTAYSPSKYRVCIIRDDGTAVKYFPGSHEEYDLAASIAERVVLRMPYKVHVDEIVRRLERRGVGLFKTQKAVLDAVREEILKIENEANKMANFEGVLEEAIEDVLFLVKSEVLPE